MSFEVHLFYIKGYLINKFNCGLLFFQEINEGILTDGRKE